MTLSPCPGEEFCRSRSRPRPRPRVYKLQQGVVCRIECLVVQRRREETLSEDEDDDVGRGRFGCGYAALWTGEREKTHLLKLTPEPAAPLETALVLLFAIQEKYPIDPDRVYVTGISMGGFATWEAMIRHPENFAASIPVCGGGDVTFADRIKHIPVWAFHGAEDPVVPVICSQSMIEKLEQVGGHPRYTEYPGVGHNSWDRAYAEPELLSWLFSQKR